MAGQRGRRIMISIVSVAVEPRRDRSIECRHHSPQPRSARDDRWLTYPSRQQAPARRAEARSRRDRNARSPSRNVGLVRRRGRLHGGVVPLRPDLHLDRAVGPRWFAWRWVAERAPGGGGHRPPIHEPVQGWHCRISGRCRAPSPRRQAARHRRGTFSIASPQCVPTEVEAER